MTWLGWAKLRPASRPEQAPRQGDLLPTDIARRPPVKWRISLDGAPIGWARQEIERLEDGQGSVTSQVHLERLSIDHVLKRGLGNLAMIAARGLGQYPRELTLTIDNRMRFDHFGQLLSFRASVQEGEWGECIRLQGTVYDDQLVVKAYLTLGKDPIRDEAHEPLKELRLRLPENRLLTNSLAPRSQFENLRVGQTWTFETYNPLFPTQPMQTVQATVIGKEMLQQGEERQRTFHVVYERATDDGLSVERGLGDLWVKPDGVVVRQRLTWGTLTLMFDRLPEETQLTPILSPEQAKLTTNSPGLGAAVDSDRRCFESLRRPLGRSLAVAGDPNRRGIRIPRGQWSG